MKSVSILSGRDTIIAKNVVEAIQSTHPLHPQMSNEEYETIRQVYYPVMEKVQTFFVKNCIEKDYNLVNEAVQEELIRAQVYTLGTIVIAFHSDEELKEVREYVYHLPYPASVEEMNTFFKEVGMGRLEFMCRYPLNEIGGVTLLDKVKSFL